MALHAPGPAFLVELHKRLQLPQAMRVAKRMLHTRHRPIALPVVVHCDPGHPRRHGAAPLAYPIRRQQEPAPDPIRGCADRMEPPRACANAKPGLVQMLHTRPDRRKLLYMPCRNTQTLRSPPAHRRQRRRRHTSPEQLPQNLRQPALRKELPMAKPNRHSRKTPAILNRTRYPLGERRSRHDPATPAAARMTAMLRHFQRTRLRKVEYLTRYRRAHRSRSQQRRPAALAHRRNMGLHPVRGLRA